MPQIDVPYQTWVLLDNLAQRLEWPLEKVLHEALVDATDLQDDIEFGESRELSKLLGSGK